MPYEAAAGRFFSRAGHDLFTPLNAILGFSGLMQALPDEALASSARDYAFHIHQAGRVLLGHVNALLAAGDYLQRQGGLPREELDAGAIMNEIVHARSGIAHSAGITICLSIDPNLPHLFAEESLLRHAFDILLDNALAAAPSGSVVEIELCRASGGGMEIVCKDQGLPVTLEEVEREEAQMRGETDIDICAMRRINTGIGLLRQLLDVLGGAVVWGTSSSKSRIAFVFPPRSLFFSNC